MWHKLVECITTVPEWRVIEYPGLLFYDFVQTSPHSPPLYTSTLGMSPNTTNTIPVDTQLQDTSASTGEIPIDPALFAIEQIVNDARRNKARQVGEDETRRAVEQLPVSEENEAGNGSNELGMLDDEFDPALREIVNSLTNAQQVCTLKLTLADS